MKTLLLTLALATVALSAETISPPNFVQTFDFDGGACMADQTCTIVGYGGGHVAFFEWDMKGKFASLHVYLVGKFTSTPVMVFNVSEDPSSPGNLRITGDAAGDHNQQPFNMHFTLSLHPYPYVDAYGNSDVLYALNPMGNRVTLTSNIR